MNDLTRTLADPVMWNAVHKLLNDAIRNGEAADFVDGIGSVCIVCRKQVIYRARGEAVRKRFTYFLNGERVTGRAVWSKTGSCPA